MTETIEQTADPAMALRPYQRANELPGLVLDELPNLTARQGEHFVTEYERRRKSGFWSWATWFIGWHFGYIEGRWGLAFLFFIAFGPTLGIWWLYEGIFRVRKRLANQRHEVAIAALRDVRAVATSP